MPELEVTDLRRRLAELRLSPAREAEIVEELSQHLDDRYEELRAAGSSDADARRLALEELNEAGGLAQRMQALSQAHTPPPIVHGQPSGGLLRGVWQDLRYALRTVRRQPGFSATIVVTLAVGHRRQHHRIHDLQRGDSPPHADHGRGPGRQAQCGERRGRTEPQCGRLIPGLSGLADSRLDARSRISRQPRERTAAVSGDERPAARVNAAYVSWNTFSMIGQPPALGRDFAETDDREGALPVVILGGSLWRARYGADPSIVGTTIRVGGVPSTVDWHHATGVWFS